MAKDKAAEETKVENGVKRATVVYVDGRTIGINESGEKFGGDGPDKDKLKTEHIILLDDVQYLRAVEHEDKRNEAKDIKRADIKPGDRISTSWTDERKRPTSVTIFPAEKKEGKGPRVVHGHLHHAPQRRASE